MVIYNMAGNIALYNYEMMKTYEVHVTWIHDPSNIFVRPATVTQADLAALEVAGDPIPQEEIIEGKIVVYFSDILNKLIRGKLYRVISTGDYTDRCAIYAIDYGFYDIRIPFLDIFNQGGDPTIEPLAISCRLSNCFPVGNTSVWPVYIATIFKMMLSEPTVYIYVRIPSGNFLWIDLYTRNNLNIGKLMVEYQLAKSIVWYRRQDN